MHPLLTAWLTYVAVLDRQPRFDSAEWGYWLDAAEAREQWWAILRRLPIGTR